MLPVLIIFTCIKIFKVLASNEESMYNKGLVICSTYGYQLVEAKFGKETHLLCLKMNDIGKFNFRTS